MAHQTVARSRSVFGVLPAGGHDDALKAALVGVPAETNPVSARLSGHVRTSAGQGQGYAIAEPVLIFEVLVTQRMGHHPLCDKGLEAMLDTLGIAVIDEAGSETSGDVRQAIGFLRLLGTTFGGHSAAVEIPNNLMRVKRLLPKSFRDSQVGPALESIGAAAR